MSRANPRNLKLHFKKHVNPEITLLSELHVCVYIYIYIYIWSHTIHGTGIFTQLLPQKSTIHVGKYTVRPMDNINRGLFCLLKADLCHV